MIGADFHINNIQFPVALGFMQHQSYEDDFFNGFQNDRDCIDVSDIDPFGSVHVISPLQKIICFRHKHNLSSVD